MVSKKKCFFTVLVLVVFVLYTLFVHLPNFNYRYISNYVLFTTSGGLVSESRAVRNQRFVVNNNLAQYSSYLVEEQEDRYRVEGFVQYRYKYVSEKQFGGKENFSCVVKLVNVNGNHTVSEEEILVLEVFEVPRYYWNPNRKYICHLNPSSFKSVGSDRRNFNPDNVLVAIVWKSDYDFASGASFSGTPSASAAITLPASLIGFQKPTVFRPLNPHPPSVSFCVHYTYMLPSQFFNWIDMHLEFGVQEIMFYDGLDNQELTSKLKQRYGDDKRITVTSFEIDVESLCGDEVLFKRCTSNQTCTPLVLEMLKRSCLDFHNAEFRERFHWRGKFEQLTSNDCYTVLSKRHEFIGYYDLDEFVFPRSLDALKDFYDVKRYDSCSTYSAICSLKPFQNSFDTKRLDSPKTNYFYNYLRSQVEAHRGNRDISKLSTIGFDHSAMLIPNHIEKQLMQDLGEIVKDIEQNVTTTFPINLFLSEPPYNDGHTFIINAEDVDFIKYLHASYTSLMPCVHREHLKKIQTLDQHLVRYLYYLTEGNERMGKSIHYYKNVKSVFVHYAEHVEPGSWAFTASALNGHTSPHFRADVSVIYKSNFKGSIRKLYLDFEYLFYLLKNHTSFCHV